MIISSLEFVAVGTVNNDDNNDKDEQKPGLRKSVSSVLEQYILNTESTVQKSISYSNRHGIL